MALRYALRVFAVAFVTGIVTDVKAQPSPGPQKYRILTIDYHKPEPGKVSQYVGAERDYWKPIHQDRVKNGKITSWRLYSVSFPNGEDQEYDFVTMTEFANFADLEAPYAGTDARKILGEGKAAEMTSMTNSARKLKRSDTVAILLATEGWSKAPNKVLAVHYLKALPGKGADLMKVQREFYLPSNEDHVRAGSASSWATTVVRFPQQFDARYNYISFNGYESLAQMEKRSPQEWIDKWSGKSKELMPLLNASRTRVQGQLWRLVDQTQ